MAAITSEYKRLIAKGLVVIPIWDIYLSPSGKKVLKPAANWRSFTLADSELARDKHIKGIGLLTGEVNHIMVVDIDDPALVQPALGVTVDELIEALNTPIAKTRKGYHFYFKFDPRFANKRTNLRNSKIDLISENAFIIIPPTSYGDHGYTWLKYDLGHPPMELPPLLQDFLLACHTESPGDSDDTTAAESNDSINALLGEVAKCGGAPPRAYPAPSEDSITFILEHISQERADNYDLWIKVLIALKNSGETYLEHAQQFSMRSTKYKSYEFEDTWSTIQNGQSAKSLTIGSLYYWLQRDDPGAYKSLRNKPEFHFGTTIISLLNLSDIANVQVERHGYAFGASGKCACGKDATSFKIFSLPNSSDANIKNLILKCDACSGKRVCYLSNRKGLGCLPDNLETVINSGIINKDEIYLCEDPYIRFNMRSTELCVNGSKNYLMNQNAIDTDENLSHVFPPKYQVNALKWKLTMDDANVLVIQGDDDRKPCLKVIGGPNIADTKKPKVVGELQNYYNSTPFSINQNDARAVVQAVNKSIQNFLLNDMRLSTTIVSNIAINCNITTNATSSEPNVNEVDLIEALTDYLDDYIIESEASIYKFDVETKTWGLRTKNEVSAGLLNLYKLHFGHLITDKDKKFFTSANSLNKVHQIFVSNEYRNKRDRERAKLLDSKEFLFPFRNKVYDLRNDILRDIEKEDYIMVTTDYDIRDYDAFHLQHARSGAAGSSFRR